MGFPALKPKTAPTVRAQCLPPARLDSNANSPGSTRRQPPPTSLPPRKLCKHMLLGPCDATRQFCLCASSAPEKSVEPARGRLPHNPPACSATWRTACLATRNAEEFPATTAEAASSSNSWMPCKYLCGEQLDLKHVLGTSPILR